MYSLTKALWSILSNALEYALYAIKISFKGIRVYFKSILSKY